MSSRPAFRRRDGGRGIDGDVRESREKVVELLRDRFERGEFAARRRIPSQAEMAEEFGVSGRTIARAIAHLRDQGYLWTLPHKGSYARPRKDWRPRPTEPDSVRSFR